MKSLGNLHLFWLNELELHAPASPRDGSCVGRIVQKGDLVWPIKKEKKKEEWPGIAKAGESRGGWDLENCFWKTRNRSLTLIWKKNSFGPEPKIIFRTWKTRNRIWPGKTGGPGWPPGPPGPQLVAWHRMDFSFTSNIYDLFAVSLLTWQPGLGRGLL